MFAEAHGVHGNIDRQPYNKIGQHRGQNIGTTRPSSTRWAVLLAEDDAPRRRYFSALLRGAGFEVDDAATGTAAWKQFQNNSYDLVITDNDMPGMCGVELFARIRRRNEEIPVLLMSDNTTAAQICRDAGFETWHFLLKPFSAERLIATVMAVLKNGQPWSTFKRNSTDFATRNEEDVNCVGRGVGI